VDFITIKTPVIFRQTINMDQINWGDFEKVEMRIGTILKAEIAEGVNKPAYRLQIDFGANKGILRSSAQLTSLYQVEELAGKQVVAVVNFPPKQIGKFISECLVLGAVDADGRVTLLEPGMPCADGLRIA
jgi:tRNA-binding protein